MELSLFELLRADTLEQQECKISEKGAGACILKSQKITSHVFNMKPIYDMIWLHLLNKLTIALKLLILKKIQMGI